MSDPDIASGIGPFKSLPTVTANNNLGTSPTLITIADGSNGRPRHVKVKIINPNAAAVLAWTLINDGDAAPSIVATFGAGAGSHILPGTGETFSMMSNQTLYLVSDTASSSYSVTSVLFP